MTSPNPKRAIVLVHGFLGASNNWLGVTAKLRSRPEFHDWEIVCPDLRWHSGDPERFTALKPQETPPTTQMVAEALARDLNVLDANEMVVLGHSFGLRPLLKILAQGLLQGKKVVALIAEDSTPELSSHGTKMLEDILGKTPVPFTARDLARQYFDDAFGASSALSRFLLSNIREDLQRGGHTWRFSHEVLLELLRTSAAESLEPEWCAIDAPVQMIVGDRSEHLPESLARKWQAKRLDKSKATELVFIKDAGHWVHAEQSDQFVSVICEYLVKVVRSIS